MNEICFIKKRLNTWKNSKTNEKLNAVCVIYTYFSNLLRHKTKNIILTLDTKNP